MSATNPQVTARSRWMDWRPKVRILAQRAGIKATETTEYISDVFVADSPAQIPEIGAAPNEAELAYASVVLNRNGVRIMDLENGPAIGVWSDLDGPEIRAALRTLGSDRLPLRYLDGDGVPARYKVRVVEGEPVPWSVLVEMEQNPIEPWKVRDAMLTRIGWRSKPIPSAEWWAATLNRLSKERGVTGRPGRITAATVRHGEQKWLAMSEKGTRRGWASTDGIGQGCSPSGREISTADVNCVQRNGGNQGHGSRTEPNAEGVAEA